MGLFNNKHYVELDVTHPGELTTFNIKITKLDIDFFIQIKEVYTDHHPSDYVWFLFCSKHDDDKKILCSYSTKPTFGIEQCQQAAINYITSLPYSFFQKLKNNKY